MTTFDCFNGDADGVCALTQLRLANPLESTLITGVKRDINLLKHVTAQAGDVINVLDISLDKNRADLARCLQDGAQVFYCDHHYAGEIPSNAQLTTLINTTADVCTSLLVNQHLHSQFLEWAVVGTFGDNLNQSAIGLAKSLALSATQLTQLKNLGVYLNYNGYGESLEDLYFHPSELFKKTVQYTSAFDFMQDDAATFSVLEQGYQQDMANAQQQKPLSDAAHAQVIALPNAAWSRRVSGVFGNHLANQTPTRAHAVVTAKSDGDFVVSVRAPLDNKTGADQVCRQFATGGGRAAAAGINALNASELHHFIDVFSRFYADA